MPGRRPTLLYESFDCPRCGHELVRLEPSVMGKGDVNLCSCGFDSRIEVLRARGGRLPWYACESPAGVRLEEGAAEWHLSAWPRSARYAAAVIVLVAGLGVLFAESSPLLAVVLGGMALAEGAAVVLSRASIRVRGRDAAISSGIWNALRPVHLDWGAAAAIRLYVGHYSNGEARSAIVLEADQVAEFGSWLEPEQKEFVLRTLFRKAVEYPVAGRLPGVV